MLEARQDVLNERCPPVSSETYTDPMRFVEGEQLAERGILTSSAYTSPEQLTRERSDLFSHTWLFACYARDVAEPGAVQPMELDGKPVLVVRDGEGTLRAFHNVCSHRGSKLVCEPLKARKTLVCPYHAWIYNLNGELVRSQHFAGVDRRELPDLPAPQLGLKELPVGELLDFVFINFDTDAAPFAEQVAPLTERWADYDLSVLRHGASLRYDFKANWKLVVENFLESYHVPFIHQTLNTYSPFTERYQIRLSEELIGIGQGLYAPEHESEAMLPRWPVRSTKESLRAEYFSVFPRFLIGLMPDHLFAWHLEPLAADRTIEHLDFYFVGEEGVSPRHEKQREATLTDWKRVNDEDWDIIQRMHAGCLSPAFDRAILSRHMERNINNFHELVIKHLKGTPS